MDNTFSLFKSRVKHTRGVDRVAAGAMSRSFEGNSCEAPDTNCVALLPSCPRLLFARRVPEVGSLLVDLRDKIRRGRVVSITSRCLEVLCFTILKYFNDSVL